MKKYIVKALSVGGQNNKIYHSGDEVTSEMFPEGHAEKLVTEGFLISAEDKEEVKKDEPKKESVKEETKKSKSK